MQITNRRIPREADTTKINFTYTKMLAHRLIVHNYYIDRQAPIQMRSVRIDKT